MQETAPDVLLSVGRQVSGCSAVITLIKCPLFAVAALIVRWTPFMRQPEPLLKV
jgi:hypothetical protein